MIRGSMPSEEEERFMESRFVGSVRELVKRGLHCFVPTKFQGKYLGNTQLIDESGKMWGESGNWDHNHPNPSATPIFLALSYYNITNRFILVIY
jgi:hypothetical protein